METASKVTRLTCRDILYKRVQQMRPVVKLLYARGLGTAVDHERTPSLLICKSREVNSANDVNKARSSTDVFSTEELHSTTLKSCMK